MAYMMSDMAAGSTAALQMQKNMAAAPYVQQETAAAAEDTQLKLQQDRLKAQYAPQEAALKLEQDKAIVERNRINALVTETGLKTKAEAKTKIQALMQGEEFKAADEITQAKMLNKVNLEVSNDAEEYFKNNAGIELAAQRTAKTKQQEADLNAQNLTRAIANINTIPKEQLGNYIDNLPESATKAAVAGVGNANWSRFTPEQKRDTLTGQMNSAAAQLVDQKIEGNLKTQKVIIASKERIVAANNATKVVLKTTGTDGTDKLSRLDVQVGKLYVQEQRRVDAVVKPSLERNNSLLSALKEKANHEKFANGAIKPETTAEVDRLIKENDVLEKKRNDALIKVVERLPASAYKDKLMQEHNLIDAAVSTPAKPVAKPAAKDVTKNKDSSDIQSRVEASGVKYEPTKWDYRVAPDGSIQRKAK